VVFDPGPLAGTLPDRVLRPVLGRADWVTGNARESALLTGSADPGEALRVLAARLPRAHCVRPSRRRPVSRIAMRSQRSAR